MSVHFYPLADIEPESDTREMCVSIDLNSNICYCFTKWIEAGQGGPWRAMAGHGGPRRATAGHGGPWRAMAGHGGPGRPALNSNIC